ncbi:MAG: glycerol-3-phosphate dehydrogenase/oxidase [Kofleriaceae bacterium]|nr:glycerol-3-phosphate dehydrogenase/oxidase [Kofleriaceae bacterium]
MAGAPYDIVIIGGGITGAGIARDASLRGLRVALFEKDDFGSGTSSKSSKLIHGGLRYLEHAEFALVFESVSERGVQMAMAPHLVRPLPFLVPVFEDARVGLELLNVGLWIYETLALFRSPQLHKTMRGAGKVLEAAPRILSDGLKGAIEFYDCYTDDSRLVLENIISAEEAGARCEAYTEVLEILRERGQVSGVRVRNRISGEEEVVETASVVMATGPWSDKVSPMIKAGIKTPLLSPTKGVHAVFPHELLPLKRAMTIMSPIDERVMFAIPWRGRTVIGTTDTYFDGDPDEVHADAEDVQYLCDSANHLFPSANFTPESVIATWAGLRPLIHEEADSASDVSREHQIYVNDDGVILIAGGKLTTYRLMAKDTVKAAIRWMRDWKNDHFADRELKRPRTKKRPLPGGVGFTDPSANGVKALAETLAKESGLPLTLTEHWAFTYGMRAKLLSEMAIENPALQKPLQDDLPHTWAEIEFAILNERTETVDDVLSRRVPMLLIAMDQGLDIVEATADRMAEIRGWDSERRALEVSRYQTTVSQSRLFRGS